MNRTNTSRKFRPGALSTAGAIPPRKMPVSTAKCVWLWPTFRALARIPGSGANVGPPGQALLAPAAEELVVHGDPIAGPQPGALAGRLHHPGRLVPEGHRIGIGLDHAVEDVQVRAAHAS